MLLRPALGLAHELLVVALAAMLRWTSDAPLWPALIGHLPIDPVYTLALIQFAGEISPRGVAVADPAGGLLHAALPGLFAPPELVPNVWASAVLDPGSTILARGLAGFGADFILLMIGLMFFLVGIRRKPWLAVCGALQQAHVVLYKFLQSDVSLQDLEAAGLPFAVSSLLSGPNQRASWFTNELGRLPEVTLSLAGGALLVGLAYCLAAVLLLATLMTRRAARKPGAQTGPSASFHLRSRRLPGAVLLSLSVLVLALSPLGALAEVETQVLGSAPARVASFRPRSLTAADTGSSEGPVKVSFLGSRYRYAVLVNGAPRVIRGMGYNAEYASLDSRERVLRYDSDFQKLREIGVNVIFGWFQDQFDSVTLAKARQHGLGVAMPFELNQDTDYDDPAACARLTEEVLRYVALHKDDPAVWFWTPGNEVIHRLMFPSWLRHQTDPVKEARADSFATFYVQLIDQIHALDPKHPIIYRDAEDHYLPRIREALQAGGVQRPWFAYGTNVYSRRLGEVLQNWPSQGLDVPLLVSEFAPGGTGSVDRPHALRSMWETIRAYPNWVIGGAVYTWSTNGPEELDRVFGLVDEYGQPRGEAVATVGEFYGGYREVD